MSETKPDNLAARQGYLRHVDGLRGISVLLVVLYHAWPEAVPGGFIGVDVFFVISGFLITRLLLAEQSESRFSYTSFLLRRVRRLWPSFALVLLVTLGLGWVLLEPGALADMGRSALAAMGFGSNWYFALTTDYFNEGLRQNFLLHSWSLAVEEQFYLVYPLMLLWLAKSGKRLQLGLVAIWGVSLGAVFVLPRDPANFFVTHLRVWELASGALVWVVLSRGFAGSVTPSARRWIGMSGLLLLVGAALLMPHELLWPSALTLVPVIGAALCIAFAWRGLEVRWLVGLGLISYALYLWHWPLLQALGILRPRATDGLIVGVVLLSIGVSWLAWRFVEEPVRRGRALIGNSRLLGVFVMVTLSAGVFSWQMHARDGFPARLPAEVTMFSMAERDAFGQDVDCRIGLDDLARIYGLAPLDSAMGPEIQVCRFGGLTDGPPNLLYVGDSHLGAIQAEIARRGKHSGHAGLFIGLAACPVIPGVVWETQGAQKTRQCKIVQNILSAAIGSGDIEQIVLVGHWDIYGGATPTGLADFNEHFLRLAKAAAGKTDLHVLLDVPTHDFDVPQALIRSVRWPWLVKPDWLTREKHELAREPYLAVMQEIVQRGEVVLHDPVPVFCPEEVCLSADEEGALYYDGSHLTRSGAAFLLDSLPDLPH